jgi:hypothetical protein
MSAAPGGPQHRSIIYSSLILAGILMAIAGLVIAVLGVGKPSATEISGSGVDVKTSSVGLVILVVGAGLAGILAVKKPSDIELFTNRPMAPTLRTRVIDNAAIPALAVAVVGVVLLIVSLVLG